MFPFRVSTHLRSAMVVESSVGFLVVGLCVGCVGFLVVGRGEVGRRVVGGSVVGRVVVGAGVGICVGVGVILHCAV